MGILFQSTQNSADFHDFMSMAQDRSHAGMLCSGPLVPRALRGGLIKGEGNASAPVRDKPPPQVG